MCGFVYILKILPDLREKGMITCSCLIFSLKTLKSQWQTGNTNSCLRESYLWILIFLMIKLLWVFIICSMLFILSEEYTFYTSMRQWQIILEWTVWILRRCLLEYSYILLIYYIVRLVFFPFIIPHSHALPTYSVLLKGFVQPVTVDGSNIALISRFPTLYSLLP